MFIIKNTNMKSLIFILSIIIFAQLSLISLSRLRIRSKHDCAQNSENCQISVKFDVYGNCCHGECHYGLCVDPEGCTLSGEFCVPGIGNACCSGCSILTWKCV